jgi:hypothetical protein
MDLGQLLEREVRVGNDKRRKSNQDDSDDIDLGASFASHDGPTPSRKNRHDKNDDNGARTHKGNGDEKGEEVAKVMTANDRGGDGRHIKQTVNDNEVDEDRNDNTPKNGKKAKHIPGSHHRDDRLQTASSANHHPHHGSSGHHVKHGSKEKRRYLSSNLRIHEKRTLSIWDYDRHVKRMGEFDPLHGTTLREEMERRGHGVDDRGDRHSKHAKGEAGGHRSKHGNDENGRHPKHDEDEDVQTEGMTSEPKMNDFHASPDSQHSQHTQHHPVRPIVAMEQGGQVRGDSLPDLDKQDTLPSHRQGVTLGDASVSSQSLASPAHAHPNEARGLLDPLRVDDMLGLEYEAYDCEDEYDLGHGYTDLLGRDEGSGTDDWQPQPEPSTSPVPSPSQRVSVLDGGSRMYADKIIWQPTSDHPEKQKGGLERRRKDKHNDDGDEDDSGDKHGRGRHGDDEEDDYGHGKHGGKHGDEDYDDGEYGSSSSRKKGKGSYDDDGEDSYSAKGSGRGSSRAGSDGYVDDFDTPRSRSGSRYDDPESGYPSTKQNSHSKFDDGQYRPSSYQSNADDCAILSSFYTSMRGETWTPAVDWSASAVSSRSGTASCCSWTGITCDEYQRVIGLDVSSLGLSGPLGTELFSLDALLRL